MVDISKHPLLRTVYDLMQMIEEFPPSDHQTATIIKAVEILDGVEFLRSELAAMKERAEKAEGELEQLKIKYDEPVMEIMGFKVYVDPTLPEGVVRFGDSRRAALAGKDSK